MRQARRPRTKSTPSRVPSSLRKIFFLFFCLIILGLVAGIVWYMWFMPVKWGTDTSKNIVLVSNNIDSSIDSILYISLSYQNQSMVINSIPATEVKTVPGGYGEYPLKSVRPLLALDKKTKSEVVATYSYLLGIPVDEVWETGNKVVFEQGADPNQFADAILWRKIDTDLGFKDSFQLYQFIRKLQPKMNSFSNLEGWQEKQSNRFSSRWKNCRLTLVNTTSVVGLGGRVGRVLEKGGAIVVRLTDIAEPAEKSRITVQPNVKDCQDLSLHIQGIFPSSIEATEDPDILNTSRSEAELILGQDLGEFLQ